jgi:hypothetical protein
MGGLIERSNKSLKEPILRLIMMSKGCRLLERVILKSLQSIDLTY